MRWHDLGAAFFGEDLPLWRAMAGEAGVAVVASGARTGRVGSTAPPVV